jgi:hypothetical protein
LEGEFGGIRQKKLQKVDSMQLEGEFGGMQLKIEMKLKIEKILSYTLLFLEPAFHIDVICCKQNSNSFQVLPNIQITSLSKFTLP